MAAGLDRGRQAGPSLFPRLLAFLLLLMLPGQARAEWMEASSPHFVIYANDSERDLKRFAGMLERYHRAMEVVTANPTERPSPSNRVTIYVAGGEVAVERLARSREVAGFYIPRPGHPLIITPRISFFGAKTTWSLTVLLHEYAHHFMWSQGGFPMPRWQSEGAAEYFSNARFLDDGSIQMGLGAQYRGWDLLAADRTSAEALVRPDARSDSSFYAKAWALYHMLASVPERKGQGRAYMKAIAEGTDPVEAAASVFGDLRKLEREIDAYVRKPRLTGWKVLPAASDESGVTIRRLTPGEAQMMPLRMRSVRGVTEEEAAEVVTALRKIAALHPSDPAVLSALAEAEFDAGDDAAAIAAADRALALDPKNVNALVQKGYALFRRAADAEDQVAAYAAARKPFVALNAIENDHPLPLVYYYHSFAMAGRTPPPLALQGLERAAELAPYDLGLRATLAFAQLRAGKREQASFNLKPIAYHPHGGPGSERAREALARIEREPQWDGSDFSLEVADEESAPARR